MKTIVNKLLIVLVLITFVAWGCSKTYDSDTPATQDQNVSDFTPHIYGVLPTTPDMVIGMPVYSSDPKATRALQATYTIPYNPAVRDQGQIGSCTAFCGTEANEILYYYKDVSKYSNLLLSPAFLYYCERVLILKQRITADNGAAMVNIGQALAKYGDCLETSYPYPSSNKSTQYKTAPTTAVMNEGLKYKCASSSLISTGDVTAVKNKLNANIPVMMGFNVYDNTAYTYFERLNTTNSVYNPLTTSGSLATGVRLLGGHATPIVGYDDNVAGGSFLVQNSWGTSWGNAGYFWMPYTVFKSTKIVPASNCFFLN
jgi:C1A family cysteine protease